MSLHMGINMGNPDFVMCKQQKRRTACVSTQSDQHLCERIMTYLATATISIFSLDFDDEQTCLSITLSRPNRCILY